MSWTQQEAIDLCWLVEPIAFKYGYHVALTGGTLYKPGNRKDADLLFYRHKSESTTCDFAGLRKALKKELGFKEKKWTARVTKFEWNGRSVDALTPEDGGDYEAVVDDDQPAIDGPAQHDPFDE